jgi:CYTH domain-containing protein
MNLNYITTMDKKENLEIERKFILNSIPIIDPIDVLNIEQHYIELNNEKIRLRMSYSEEESLTTCWKTKKTSLKPGVNKEEEEKISFSEYTKLINEEKDHYIIRKTRYLYRNASDLWEVDNIKDTDIIMAECEIPDLEYDLKIPNFIQNILSFEATNSDEFSNFQIAKRYDLKYD